MKKYFISFYQLFFPNTCHLCGDALYKHENYICNKCINKLPRTYYHLLNNNPAEQSLWGRIPIESVYCYLFYKKGNSAQKLIYDLKYKGEKEIGLVLGKLFTLELSESNVIIDADIIIPVPLHPKKRIKRGYNQSEWVAKGISQTTNIPINTNVLIKIHNTTSQTRKNRFNRFLAVKDMFAVNDIDKLKNKHILIVDDVLTTGSTIEACYMALSKIPNIKISVLTIACSTR